MLSLLLSGCDDEQRAQCRSDDDCREGYRCDLVMYVGECIKRQQVQACGEIYCRLPDERCLQDRCVAVEGEAGGSVGGGMGGDIVGGQQAGGMIAGGVMEGGEVIGGQLIGGNTGGTSVGGDTPTGGEMVEGDLWRFEISSVNNQHLITLSTDQSLMFQGMLRTRTDTIPLRAILKLKLIRRESGDVVEERPVALGEDGDFTLELDPQNGTYRVELIATDANAPSVTQASYQLDVRWIDWVQIRGENLYLTGSRYRYFGVSLPDLLPWLSQLDLDLRSESMRGLCDRLRSWGVDVIRVYVGWSGDSFSIQDGQGGLSVEGQALVELLVKTADEAGLRVIMTLADGRREIDTLTAYLRSIGIQMPTEADEMTVFQSGRAREALLNWLIQVPSMESSRTGVALSEDPAILGWELLHLPRWLRETVPNMIISRTELREFMTEATNRVALVAPQQLILTGEYGLDINPTPYLPWSQQLGDLGFGGLLSGAQGGDWRSLRPLLGSDDEGKHVSGFSIDAGSFGAPEGVSWPQVGQLWIRAHATAHFGVERPLVIHLMRAGDVVAENQRVSTLDFWVREASSQGLDGIIIGEVLMQNNNQELMRAGWPFGPVETEMMIRDLSAQFNRD